MPSTSGEGQTDMPIYHAHLGEVHSLPSHPSPFFTTSSNFLLSMQGHLLAFQS